MAKEEVAVEAEVARRDCSAAAVVALDAADGDDAVGALGQRLCHQELQLPDLVARELHPAEVVALNEELHAVGDPGDVPAVDRRWKDP